MHKYKKAWGKPGREKMVLLHSSVKQDREAAPYIKIWGKPGKGRYLKRAYNKAVRRAAKGTGKTRSVAYWAGEIHYGKHSPSP